MLRKPRQVNRLSASHGFTLIELLVVVLIMGIVLTFLSLSINTNSAAERLDREAQRLEALARAATDEAILYGVEIGLDITPDGYRFVRLGQDGWQVIAAPDQPLRARTLDPGMRIVRISEEDEERATLPGGRDDSDDEDEDVRLQPEALFLSSGETLPFVLELYAADVAHRYRLVGQANGTLELNRLDGPA